MVDGGIYVNVPTFDSVMYLTFLSDIHILYTVVLRTWVLLVMLRTQRQLFVCIGTISLTLSLFALSFLEFTLALALEFTEQSKQGQRDSFNIAFAQWKTKTILSI